MLYGSYGYLDEWRFDLVNFIEGMKLYCNTGDNIYVIPAIDEETINEVVLELMPLLLGSNQDE